MAFENVKDLDSLSPILQELASRISAPQNLLPPYNKPGDGAPHIEHDSRGFHYVIAERGKERRRTTTNDASELLYLVFQDITFNLAMAYELKNRIEKRDCRRILWQHQLELLGRLDDSWRIKMEVEIQNILIKHPYKDVA